LQGKRVTKAAGSFTGGDCFPTSAAGEGLFVGCGTSNYLALSAAASWIATTGRRARAAPPSELSFFPDSVRKGWQTLAAVARERLVNPP